MSATITIESDEVSLVIQSYRDDDYKRFDDIIEGD